jgi:hypothetical protein
MAKILEISSMFPNIYRISTDNGIIIDIFEENKPSGTIKYSINSEHNNYDTELYGTVYSINNDAVYISFGGLIGYFPKKLIDFPIDNKHNITFKYSLCQNNEE